jgi:hypothetical protein
LLRRLPRCSCSVAHSVVDGHPALLLLLLHRVALLLSVAASALWPASPNGAGESSSLVLVN